MKVKKIQYTLEMNVVGWYMYASPLTEQRSFQIKTFEPIWICPRSFQNSRVDSAFIARIYRDQFKDNGSGWKNSAIQSTVVRDLGVEVSRYQANRARKFAKELVEGDERSQYRNLWDYAWVIKSTNTGSQVII